MRGLWLHRAVAGKLVGDPYRVVGRARRNLRRLQAAHPRGPAARVLADWAQILDGQVEAVAEVLTSKDQRAIELRQNSPFAGLLGERERTAVLRSFREGSVPA